MKKLTLLLTALMFAGVTFAEEGKGCCKGKKACGDKKEAKACTEKEASCCTAKKEGKDCTKECKEAKAAKAKAVGKA